MRALPARPDLDQLRHQARDLLRAAQAGDPDATERIGAVSDRLILAAAQLVIARDHGFPSWARLKAEVDRRAQDLAQRVDAFLEASIRDWTGSAARMLAASPELEEAGFGPAVVLGDVDRVREELSRDPAAATRPDPRTGWTPLHAACATRWYQLDPARADGLVAIVRLLLDAGADLDVRPPGPRGGPSQWTPLRCAVAGMGGEPVIRLVLEHGAVPQDHDFYLASFAPDPPRCMRALLDHTPDVAATVDAAFSGPISTGDVESCRLLLEAGADPRRYREDPPCGVVYAAARDGAPVAMVELLIAHGADPNAPGPDGRSPYRLALARGAADVAAALRRAGADDDATDLDRLLAAALAGDAATARRLATDHPGVLDGLARADRSDTLARAAEEGRTAAVELLLDLGFPVDVPSGDEGRTPLHAAAYAGAAEAIRLLLARGAPTEARDTQWDDTPLGWAMVGSGERPRSSPAPDWVATVRALLAAGASTAEITLSPDAQKPPSVEVAQVLREHGVGEAQGTAP